MKVNIFVVWYRTNRFLHWPNSSNKILQKAVEVYDKGKQRTDSSVRVIFNRKETSRSHNHNKHCKFYSHNQNMANWRLEGKWILPIWYAVQIEQWRGTWTKTLLRSPHSRNYYQYGKYYILLIAFFSSLSIIVIVNICQDRGKWYNSSTVRIIFFEVHPISFRVWIGFFPECRKRYKYIFFKLLQRH